MAILETLKSEIGR